MFRRILIVSICLQMLQLHAANFKSTYAKLLAQRASLAAQGRLTNFEEVKDKWQARLHQEENQIFTNAGLQPDFVRALAQCAKIGQVPCQHPDVILHEPKYPDMVKYYAEFLTRARFFKVNSWPPFTGEIKITNQKEDRRLFGKYFEELDLSNYPRLQLLLARGLGEEPTNLRVWTAFNPPDELLEGSSCHINSGSNNLYLHKTLLRNYWFNPVLPPSELLRESARSVLFHADWVVLHEATHTKYLDVFTLRLIEKKEMSGAQLYFFHEKRADIIATLQSDYPLAIALYLSNGCAGDAYSHRRRAEWLELISDITSSNAMEADISEVDCKRL